MIGTLELVRPDLTGYLPFIPMTTPTPLGTFGEGIHPRGSYKTAGPKIGVDGDCPIHWNPLRV